jgi:hypothetical protein
MPRDIDTILKEDPRLRRFVELNIDTLTDWARIGNVDIEHLSIRQCKVQMEGKRLCLTIKPK